MTREQIDALEKLMPELLQEDHADALTAVYNAMPDLLEMAREALELREALEALSTWRICNARRGCDGD